MKKVFIVFLLILSIFIYSEGFDFEMDSQKVDVGLIALPFGVVNLYALSGAYTIGYDTGYDLFGYTTPIVYLGGNVWVEKGTGVGAVDYSSYGPGLTAQVKFPFKTFSYEIFGSTYYPSLKVGMNINYFFEKVSSRFIGLMGENGGLALNFDYNIQIASIEEKDFDISWIFWPFPIILGVEILF